MSILPTNPVIVLQNILQKENETYYVVRNLWISHAAFELNGSVHGEVRYERYDEESSHTITECDDFSIYYDPEIERWQVCIEGYTTTKLNFNP